MRPVDLLSALVAGQDSLAGVNDNDVVAAVSVVVDVSIFILGKSIRSCSAFNKAKSLTQGISCTLCEFSIILISK